MIRFRKGLLLSAAMLCSLSQARAADCPTSDSAPLAVGTVAQVPPGGVRSFAIELGAGEGVIVDLVATSAMASESGADEEGPAPRALKLCDAKGNLLSPQPGEVFVKGGTLTKTDDGERLRFAAQAAGRYIVAAAGAEQAREILVRRREGVSNTPAVTAAVLGAGRSGIVSSGMPVVFSFAGTAGQWVEIKSTSERDTLLRLAAPDRTGAYSVVAENDDSEGLNPVIRRRLLVSGMYFVQVDSLADEPGEFALSLARIDAPKPPPPPAPLRTGTVSGRLSSGDDAQVYALPVSAGRSYRLELTAPYDAVVAIGMANPIEPEDGGNGPDAGFAEIKSQDAGTTGTERLNFTARGTGQVLVRVRSFGIGETDGAYTLTASDLGG